MKNLIPLVIILLALPSYSQNAVEGQPLPALIDLGAVTDNDEDFANYHRFKEEWQDVEIVMLGEQSHGEGTAYETKIKLIKYLHQEMGFEILAFESGMYDCTKAWEKIQNGEDVRTALGMSIFDLWSHTKQLVPLVRHIDENKNSEKPLVIAGFDHQFTGRISEYEFVDDLKAYMAQANPKLVETAEWDALAASLKMVVKYDVKKYKKDQASADTTFINTLMAGIDPADSLSGYWTRVLKGTKYLISDLKFKTHHRDQLMAENLIWLKENNPGKKIICWGATSHFLYNCSEIRLMKFPYSWAAKYYQKDTMMGQYVKDEYGDKVFTVGFIAYQGEFGLMGRKKIKPAVENSLEYIMEKAGPDNSFLSFENYDAGDLISRPLAHQYMENNISHVMDGVIFNKDMKRAILDHNFYLGIYPENKWMKPEVVEDDME